MKLKINSIINGAATLLMAGALVTLIISNSVTGYAMSGFALALIPSILSILASGALCFLSFKNKNHAIVSTVVGFVAICLICWAFGNIILQRSELVAAQFTYDKVNKTGWQALIPSLISIGLGIISAAGLAIGAFLKD